MPKAAKSMLANPLAAAFGTGFVMGKSSGAELHPLADVESSPFALAWQAPRDDYHLFFLLEEGAISLEIDFQPQEVGPAYVLYINPSQVHRMKAFENATVSFWAISSENLHPHYLGLLEELAPARPLRLDAATLALATDAVSLCLRVAARSHERLYHALLKDHCNALVALVASQYLAQAKPAEARSRYEHITGLG